MANVIRAVVAEAIQMRLADPRVPPITSITHVVVSEDLSVARIHVSVLAPPPRRPLCIEALQSAAGWFRRQLRPQLRLRKLPLLEFRLDESLQRSFETLEIIDGAMRELGEVPEWEREEAAAAEPPPADGAEQGVARDTREEDA